jgi:hypothetical protein
LPQSESICDGDGEKQVDVATEEGVKPRRVRYVIAEFSQTARNTSAECARNGRKETLKMYMAKRAEVNGPLKEPEIEALLAELDSKRPSGAPEWRK